MSKSLKIFDFLIYRTDLRQWQVILTLMNERFLLLQSLINFYAHKNSILEEWNLEHTKGFFSLIYIPNIAKVFSFSRLSHQIQLFVIQTSHMLLPWRKSIKSKIRKSWNQFKQTEKNRYVCVCLDKSIFFRVPFMLFLLTSFCVWPKFSSRSLAGAFIFHYGNNTSERKGELII